MPLPYKPNIYHLNSYVNSVPKTMFEKQERRIVLWGRFQILDQISIVSILCFGIMSIYFKRQFTAPTDI